MSHGAYSLLGDKRTPTPVSPNIPNKIVHKICQQKIWLIKTSCFPGPLTLAGRLEVFNVEEADQEH